MEKETRERKPHAILDEDSRYKKAKKIHVIVERFGPSKTGNFLEVGTGSGFIAAYFTKIFSKVNAIDVNDQRQTKENINFKLVSGTKLPFSDGYFDLAVSNHVIEHVGDYTSQLDHLSEIYRVLKKDGILYLAVPNRWRIIEPHYRLPLLSWFPRFLSDLYVKLTGKGKFYDCLPLSRNGAFEILQKSGYEVQEVTIDAIRIYGEVEAKNPIVKFIATLPRFFFLLFNPWIATLIFVCKKKSK
ncbi:class I SAM-dependent methyltransferase [Leptospira semungkisensis]|uniref:Class I SAM-dependent methyltransferase n=1 Tax=Leptospira semungkisensis TaxID=2484985 RepID=A0A4R9G8H5_9LEPT|nr:class I SAM-dependent methyltransferase [Leptospira semungkisensis]TGK07884.1 class I SAM-dependent methyltransferase [Leptospira semungkisensis]